LLDRLQLRNAEWGDVEQTIRRDGQPLRPVPHDDVHHDDQLFRYARDGVGYDGGQTQR
jgi:hypothetical protein